MIRSATPADGPELIRLLSQLHAAESASAATLPAVRQSSRTFVATAPDADQVIGLVVATLVDYGVSSYGMVEELVVDGARRGRGVGGSLLERCQTWLADEGVEVVFVSAKDAEVATFYGRAGFTPTRGPWLNWALDRRTDGR